MRRRKTKEGTHFFDESGGDNEHVDKDDEGELLDDRVEWWG